MGFAFYKLQYLLADSANALIRNLLQLYNSILARHFYSPKSLGIIEMTFSLTRDFGFEKGGGVNGFKDGDSIQGLWFRL